MSCLCDYTQATPWFVARTTTASCAGVIIKCFCFQGGTRKYISETFGSSIRNQRSFARNMGQSFFRLKKVPVSVCYSSNEHGVGVVCRHYTAISINVVGSKPQAYKTRPKGNVGP